MADVILHNRPEGTPSDSEFVAYGTPTTPSGQIKMSNFYNLLMSKLGFFKVSNLFNEVFGNDSAMASCRYAIGAAEYSDMVTRDNLRALKSNVIEKDSTVSYTPTIGTHPANKAYVDDRYRFGTFVYGDVPDPAVSKTVTFTPAFEDNNFIVLIEMNSLYGEVSTAFVSADTKTSNSFKVAFVETPVGGGQNVTFSYTCIHR